jgi:hypothetical protein
MPSDKKVSMMKDETPNITDLIASPFNRKKTRQGATTDPGTIILEINPEQLHHHRHIRRMAELGKLAVVQRRVVSRMLDRSIEKASQPKAPHLTVVE